MSIFAGLKSEGLEETTDRLGGFSRPDTGVYLGKIKAAYAGESAGGAQNVTMILTLAGGVEYRETIYVTNRNKENFFLNKDDKTKKVPLPGFTTIDEICQICTDKPLSEQVTEDKIVNIWDNDLKKEAPKSVPVLTELTGKDILLAIDKNLVNKSEKNSAGEYVDTAETREENTINKVFHPTLRVTLTEAKKAAEPNGKMPESLFIDSWTERNAGKTRDKRSIKDGAMSNRGRAANGNAGPPTAGGGTPRKSLFAAA